MASDPKKVPSVHEPSEIFITGRATVFYWPPARRRDLIRLTDLANSFNLTVNEGPPPAGNVPRRTWTTKRVPLVFALAEIHDNPGVAFDDWAKRWEDVGQKTKEARTAARAKAATALCRLVQRDKVRKEIREEDGKLLLYPIGKMTYD